ncbi:hypothetical protein AB0B54_35755 [Microbispora bryophytorum]|uniref:hypothetical protein n=1 Tax=Microbispora bryophytorum TaxID=1460882 RepID=UPI0033FE304D
MIRTALILVRPLLRAVDWAPLAWTWLASAAVIVTAALTRGAVVSCDAVVLSRLSAGAMGATAGFALVDPMAYGTLATPVPRWLRMWLRTALAAGAALTAWGTTLSLIVVFLPQGSPLLAGDLALEAAACVLTGLSGAAVAVRLRPRHGRSAALAGAAAQFGLLTVTLFLTAELWLWPLQDDPQWPVAHRLWLALLPLPVACLLLANANPVGRWSHRVMAFFVGFFPCGPYARTTSSLLP